jgi:hypothetical protein
VTDQSTLQAQIAEAIDQAKAAAPNHKLPEAEGAGAAFHLAAQSAGIAVQDAANALRNATTIAAAASGAAMAQFLATGDPACLVLLAHARKMVDDAIADSATIGAASARIVRDFTVR